MPISEEKKILNHFYRSKYENEVYDFHTLVKRALLAEFTYNTVDAETLAELKLNRIWNSFLKDFAEDVKNNIVPVFDIVDKRAKKVKWIGVNDSHDQMRKKHLFMLRPELYRYVDGVSDREYEALACVVCKIIGANNILLTKKGNEGGVDFVASINFSNTAHFLFGVKGPLRVVGQCKKYSTKDNVGHMKEFAQTLTDVYKLSNKAGEVLPPWFKSHAGPIIGWHISHSGHQSGALNYAKNHGILTSSTKEIIEVICKSRYIASQQNKVEAIKDEVRKALFKSDGITN
jgi:hypothetical protein